MARLVVAGIASVALVGIALGCGPKVPGHNGYKKKRKKPWTKAKVTEFDEANEAEIDGKVSWAKRRRARWYALQVTKYGDIEFEMRSEQIGGSENDEFDLAFEIINEKGKRLIVADKEEDDYGEEKKKRKLAEVTPGVYWIHVYLQNRMHAATFNFRIKLEEGEQPETSNFPKEVAFVENLPAVPPVDDTPPELVRKPRKPCKGKNCKKVTKPIVKPSGMVKTRLTGIREQSNGRIGIVIGLGSKRGVVRGARGKVVSSSGSAITNGSFKVTKVTSTKAYASVGASLDAVKSAGYVRIAIKKEEDGGDK